MRDRGTDQAFSGTWAAPWRMALLAGGTALLLAGCSGGVGGAAAGLLGLDSSESDPNGEIVLHTRSPLVLPPDYNLRPPSSEEQERQQLGANWPQDPDVLEREQRTAAAEERRREARAKTGQVLGNERALTQEELERGTIAPGTGARPADSVRSTSDRERALSPREMRSGVRDGERRTEPQPQPQPEQGQQDSQAAPAGQHAQAQPRTENRSFWSRVNPF